MVPCNLRRAGQLLSEEAQGRETPRVFPWDLFVLFRTRGGPFLSWALGIEILFRPVCAFEVLPVSRERWTQT